MGLSATGIGSVQGLSSSSMNPIQSVSYRTGVEQAYKVENEADFSDAFIESVKGLSSPESVEGAMPVQYPTATVMNRRIGQLEDSVRVNEGLNSIASAFEGLTTGYGYSGKSSKGYSVVGSHIDLFA